jgi:hypothetical protein
MMMQDSKHPLRNLWESWWPALIGFLPLIAFGVVTYFHSLPTSQVIWVFAVLIAAALAFTGLLCWRSVRLSQGRNELVKEMLRRGSSTAEIERIFRPPTTSESPLSDDEMVMKLARTLAAHKVSAPVLEEVLATFAASSPDQRRMIYGIVPVLAAFRKEEEILRAAKAVCGARSTADSRENLVVSEAIQSIAR